MVSSIREVFRELNFYELHTIFLDNNYYEILFPFLLAYALIFTILGKIKIFQSKKTGEPIKSVTAILGVIIAFYSVSFEISPGESLGGLFMVMFPNISAITIGILTLYIVGAILGKDFFKGLFNREYGGYAHIAVGVIGLGSVIFYVGISMGFWNLNPLDPLSQWNVILAVGLLILGILFLFIDLIPFGIFFLLIFGAFIFYNDGQSSILEYFVDPVMFIVLIVIVLISWLEQDSKEKLQKGIESNKKTLERYRTKDGVTGDYQSIIKDMTEEYLKAKEKKYKKRFGED